MMSKILLRVAAIVAINLLSVVYSFAQMHYDAGYVITNKGERIECFIRNEDWTGTKQECRYKLSKKGKKFVAGYNEIKAFQIYGEAKHEKHVVTFTKTPSRFTDPRVFEVSTDTLFLAVLVEGNPSLLVYDYAGYTNFFYALSDDAPVSLEYKESLDKAILYKNFQFWDQLKSLANNCRSIDENSVRKVKYTYHDLIGIFSEINKCNGVPYKAIDEKRIRNLFKIGITLTPGITQSDVVVNKFQVFYGDKINNQSIGNKTSFRLGTEIRLYSTGYRGWAAFFEPCYQHYGKADVMTDQNHGINMDLNYIDLGVGVRYSFSAGEALDFFVNALYVPYSFRMGSNAIYYDTYTPNTQHTFSISSLIRATAVL
ncbi:hypothetical protein F0919_01615 [Taibaiella lutea]|uniref:Uncharacterized protein n=1 Tax=Taibaiella lutea TaxID=2608001 RepID=A0A5M6CR13_9BACT|nr:hypothetical protein [Taibaiella lutea]KAA5536392.1 hypothetical protein F0919_01615 [Taibaiella lutea]